MTKYMYIPVHSCKLQPRQFSQLENLAITRLYVAALVFMKNECLQFCSVYAAVLSRVENN